MQGIIIFDINKCHLQASFWTVIINNNWLFITNFTSKINKNAKGTSCKDPEN